MVHVRKDDDVTDSTLAKETAEQPVVAARLLDTHLGHLDDLRAAIRPDEVEGIVLVARGSTLVTTDEMVEADVVLRIIPVISGGHSGEVREVSR